MILALTMRQATSYRAVVPNKGYAPAVPVWFGLFLPFAVCVYKIIPTQGELSYPLIVV
jgi:hypothetical protein